MPEPGHSSGIECASVTDRAATAWRRESTAARRVAAELSEIFPVQVIDPGIHRLVEEGPLRAGDGSTGRCSTWNLVSCGMAGVYTRA